MTWTFDMALAPGTAASIARRRRWRRLVAVAAATAITALTAVTLGLLP